jgi:hypothetical protein
MKFNLIDWVDWIDLIDWADSTKIDSINSTDSTDFIDSIDWADWADWAETTDWVDWVHDSMINFMISIKSYHLARILTKFSFVCSFHKWRRFFQSRHIRRIFVSWVSQDIFCAFSDMMHKKSSQVFYEFEFSSRCSNVSCLRMMIMMMSYSW